MPDACPQALRGPRFPGLKARADASEVSAEQNRVRAACPVSEHLLELQDARLPAPRAVGPVALEQESPSAELERAQRDAQPAEAESVQPAWAAAEQLLERKPVAQPRARTQPAAQQQPEEQPVQPEWLAALAAQAVPVSNALSLQLPWLIFRPESWLLSLLRRPLRRRLRRWRCRESACGLFRLPTGQWNSNGSFFP